MRPIEMKDLLDYRFLSGITAAPGGERAVFTLRQAREETNDYSSDIYLYDNGTVRRLTGDGKSGGAVWEDDRHILFPAMRSQADRDRAKAGERFSVWYRLDLFGGEAERAFELPLSCGGLKRLDETHWFFTADIHRAHPDEYAMTPEERKELARQRQEEADYHILTDTAYYVNGGGFCEGQTTALFLWNSETGEVRRLSDPMRSVRFGVEAAGKLVYAAADYQKTDNFFCRLYCYDPATGETETLYGKNDHDLWAAFRLKNDLFVLAVDYAAYGLSQNPGFYRVDNGELVSVCQPDVGFGSSVGSDCRLGGGAALRVHGDGVYYICTVGGCTQLRRMEADGTETVVNRQNGSLDCFDLTEKGTVLGIGLLDMGLQELYRLGRGRRAEKLIEFNTAALADRYVARPQPLTVRSGRVKIHGWVLLPRDFDPEKRYPAVFDIHGGPKTVYGPVFYHEMQLWASMGYFVFYCNPTGSDGRGNRFMDIRGKYGTVDYVNLMDFADGVLAAWPQIDPRRVAVTGGSYGGFMTNWIIGHTDRFACAASQRSISNWFSFFGVSDIGPCFTNDQTGGSIYTDQAKVWQHSPLKYAANVVTPTLFIHSDEDYRCPIDQGLQMYAALVQKGVDTRFVWFKGENHELSRSGKPKHRLKRLAEITAWFEKYTGGCE